MKDEKLSRPGCVIVGGIVEYEIERLLTGCGDAVGCPNFRRPSRLRAPCGAGVGCPLIFCGAEDEVGGDFKSGLA